MATKTVTRSNSKPEPKAKFDYGLTESQLRVLSNIAEAVDGLGAALSSEEPGGGQTNPERQVFSSMAQGIWGAISPLLNAIERQKLGGAQIAGNIEDITTALKEAGHQVPIQPDRKIHLTLEQAETLRDFWYAVSELSSSNLVNPEDGTGEVTTLKVVLRSVDNIFCEVIDRQLNLLEGVGTAEED